jgi:hypothetical protein
MIAQPDGGTVMNTNAIMNATVKTVDEAVKVDSADYNAFVADLELASIELVKVQCERIEAGAPAETKFDLSADYMQNGTDIHYRYELAAYFMDERGAFLGDACASLLLTARASIVGDPMYIERFGGTLGALIAQPYLREAIASTAQRIGFPGILLPMIKYQTS